MKTKRNPVIFALFRLILLLFIFVEAKKKKEEKTKEMI